MSKSMSVRFHHIRRSIELVDQIKAEGRKLHERYPRILGIAVVVEKPHQQHNTGNQVSVKVSVSLPGKLVVSSKEAHGPCESENTSAALAGAFHAAKRAVKETLCRRRHIKSDRTAGQSFERARPVEAPLRNKLLCYLAGAAMSLASVSSAAAQEELTEIPERVIAEFLGDLETENAQDPDIIRLIDILAEDPRARVKRDVLALLPNLRGKILLDHCEQLFHKLARDRDRQVRSAVAECLVRWFANMDSPSRSRVIAEWALCEHPLVRETIAQALTLDFHSLGTDVAIEHLGYDKSANVRAAMIKAAKNRFEENPNAYLTILYRLSSDRDRRVRKAARKACQAKDDHLGANAQP